jgi:hypothetical protein
MTVTAMFGPIRNGLLQNVQPHDALSRGIVFFKKVSNNLLIRIMSFD